MTINAFTDGSALRNPNGPGGWGWWVSDTVWAAGAFTIASNQKAELFAVLAVLRAVPRDQPLNIHTDSQYTIDCCTKWIKNWKRNGWKTRDGSPVKNVEIIRAIDQILLSRAATTFTKVKGHSGLHGNERADAICTAATAAVDAGRPVNAGPGWTALQPQ